MNVHNKIGNGFQEVIYQRCLAIEFNKAGLNFEREQEKTIYYDGIEVGTRRVDFFVENKVLVELKAIIKLEDVHIAQEKNYLEAFKMECGLLLNFGGRRLEYKRLFKSLNQDFTGLKDIQDSKKFFEEKMMITLNSRFI